MTKLMNVMMCLGIVSALLFAGAANAQCTKKMEATLEQILFLEVVNEFELDIYEFAEVYEGYLAYRSKMDTLTAQRAEAKAALTAAIASAEDDSNIKELMGDLIEVDEMIVRFKNTAVEQAADVLYPADQAQVYLLVSELDARKAQLRKSLCNRPCCTTAAAPCALPQGADTADATTVKSDEELIQDALNNWKDAVLTGKLDIIMATISEDFSHDGYDYEADSKAALEEFMEGMIAEGNLDDADISLEDMEIEIDGDEAFIYPIDFMNNYGAVTIELTLTKKGAAWDITDMLIEGL